MQGLGRHKSAKGLVLHSTLIIENFFDRKIPLPVKAFYLFSRKHHGHEKNNFFLTHACICTKYSDPKTGLFPLQPKRTKWIPLKRDPEPRVPPEDFVQERTVLVTSLAGKCTRLWPNDLALEIFPITGPKGIAHFSKSFRSIEHISLTYKKSSLFLFPSSRKWLPIAA